MSIEYKDLVHKTFEVVKSVDHNIVTVIGGVYPTLSPASVTNDENIDYFIFGEGEFRILKLMSAINENPYDPDYNQLISIDGIAYRRYEKIVLQEATTPSMGDLDQLPFPDYSDYDMKKLMGWGHKYTQNFQFLEKI